MLIAAFDIGGTSIKYGVITDEGEIKYGNHVPTEANKGGQAIVQKVIDLVAQLREQWYLEGITISTAGQIDSNQGVVVHATESIPQYNGIQIKAQLESATNLQVSVENDVNCAALGEHWMGVARDVQDFACLTIGTGIGGAVFTKGSLHSGDTYSAGEIGHMILYPYGKPCTCGGNGCFEQYGSSYALKLLVEESTGQKIELEDFFLEIKKENSTFVELFNEWIDYLALGITSIVHLLNPKLIVIGGGISAQGDFLATKIQNQLHNYLMPSYRQNLEIVCAEHGNQANLLGAVRHFLNQHH